MKPYFHKVPVTLLNSFGIRHDIQPNFGRIWHYHPELELHYVIKGEGLRFIGDNIGNFSTGEIILLGENLPHTWRCREEYFQNDPSYHTEAIVLQFLPDCLGKSLLNIPEAYLIPKLYEKAKRGMIIHGAAREKLAKLMTGAVHATNLDRIIQFMSILKVLAEADDYTLIASAQSFNQSNEQDTKRLNKVYNFTLSNYKKEISLEEISSICNLSITSFCRYFKLMTKKTYYDFLIEIRISHACHFLVEDKFPTELICFECGFNNVSNFYRHFKKIIGMTPLEYKRKYLAA
ncbi:AraC family transcriptional regulator [Pedobacter duraquae]|uniref:AraC-like DNA-binding protein n=1 Tax=Pedobacter duraquae TaxID=425511 RepID=A0A4R6IKH3_9SPHI|nr:AraC family transcriptional regulator [Pedobacter duraquae]TDO22533.1 AraC-like DNA-binding protein [Pedobacter duraquae]